VAICAVVVIPCVWHHHLEAGDVPSHLYNAWLAQLIVKGQLPGLFLVHQWNNVLFDFTLSGLGNLVGLGAAEKIVVSSAVLIFFWGAFALVCSVSHTGNLKRIPWFLTPCLAVFAYGYTFQMGFMNYYVSIGLAFFGLALLARSDVRSIRSVLREGRFAIFLIPLIWLAYPLGLVVFVSVGVYILLVKRLSPARQVYLFFTSVLILLALHFYIEFRHWDLSWKEGIGQMENGADQLLLYAAHDLLPFYLLQVLFLAYLLVDAKRGWRTPQWWQSYLLPVQLYSLALVAIGLLPSFMVVSHRFGKMGAIGFLSERLTSVAAILACCLLAQIKPERWHFAGFVALAAIFFWYLYWDTLTISSIEDQMDRLVASLPPGQRVITKKFYLPGLRVSVNHTIDRACIGRCFSYDNYEPPSGQFHVRVQAENPFVLPRMEDDLAVRKGNYIVQQRDLPLYEIYECNPGTTTLCISKLKAGQENGHIDTSLASQ